MEGSKMFGQLCALPHVVDARQMGLALLGSLSPWILGVKVKP
jgi:hypothetical protein